MSDSTTTTRAPTSMSLAGRIGPFFQRMRVFEINGVTPFYVAPRGLPDDLNKAAHALVQLFAAAEHDAGALQGLEQESRYAALNPTLRVAGQEAIGLMLALASFFQEEEVRALLLPAERTPEDLQN